jgi:copper transport protein
MGFLSLEGYAGKVSPAIDSVPGGNQIPPPTDSFTVKCSDVREAISARLDGEPSPMSLTEIDAHLTTCRDCAAFRERVVGLARLGADPLLGVAPDLSARILAAAPRQTRTRRSNHEFVLRLGVGLMAGTELLTSLVVFALEHGYARVDHAGHESLSFTAAICVGLLYVAFRPAAARAYVPAVAVAVALLALTSLIDVGSNRVAAWEEVPHIDLLAGFVLLVLLAREQGGGHGSRRHRANAVPPTPPRGGLHLVRSALVPSGRAVRRVLAAAAACALVLVVAPPTFAHAVLEGSDPTPDSTLHGVPATVTLTFDEPVSTPLGALRVFGPDGQRVDDGAVTHPDGEGQKVGVGLGSTTATGTYLVSWRVISADSHPVSGAFTFSVGKHSAAPVAPAITTDRTVAVLLGLTRWLGYLGACLLLGGAVFLRWCWPRGWSVVRARRLVHSGAVALAVSAATALLLKGPYDGGLGLGHLAHPDLLLEVLGSTYGRGMLVRLTLAVAAIAWFEWRRPTGSAATWLGLVGGLALAATFGFTGHAVAGTQRPLSLGSDLLHVGAMAVWLGGLLMLALVTLRSDAEPVDAVHRFSRLAATSMVVLVGTGTWQAWRQVSEWAALTGTAYGRELLVKVGLVGAVLVAAGFSRAWVVARRHPLEVHASTAGIEATAPGAPARLPHRIRRSVAAEALLGVVVLAVT